MSNLREYLVLGIWGDDHTRFADSQVAGSPEQAEAAIIEQYTGENSDNPGGELIIAGVVTIVDGAMQVVA